MLCLVLLTGCGSSSDSANLEPKIELIVSAAASMRDSMEEIKADFEEKYRHISLLYNFGGTGTLRHQIENGAPVDLVLFADVEQMNALVAGGLIAAEDHRVIVSNRLVVIVPTSSHASVQALEDLPSAVQRTLAIGSPEHVPAGDFARKALMYAGKWEQLRDKLVYTKDVRQALTYVETGNADAGIVYLTDALLSNKVKIALQIDPRSHGDILYSIGMLSSSNEEEARLFYEYLGSNEALDTFTSYGFLPWDGERE